MTAENDKKPVDRALDAFNAKVGQWTGPTKKEKARDSIAELLTKINFQLRKELTMSQHPSNTTSVDEFRIWRGNRGLCICLDEEGCMLLLRLFKEFDPQPIYSDTGEVSWLRLKRGLIAIAREIAHLVQKDPGLRDKFRKEENAAPLPAAPQ